MNSRIQEQRQRTPQQHPAVGREELLRRQESKLTNSSEFKKSYNVTVKGRSGRPNLNMKSIIWNSESQEVGDYVSPFTIV